MKGKFSDPECFEIYYLYIDWEFRRRGFGTELLRGIEKLIKERGVKCITAIEIRTFEGFWKKLGFNIDKYGMTATKKI